MKFTMFKKETTDKKYRDNEFRAVNFKRDEQGNLICPNGRKFQYLYDRAGRGNKYGRTEEFYQCEDCSNCPFSDKCKNGKGNRTIRMNEELTQIHKEVLDNFVALTEQIGFTILGLTFSPVKGPEGNIEFLGHLTLADQTGIVPDTADIVAQAHQTLRG